MSDPDDGPAEGGSDGGATGDRGGEEAASERGSESADGNADGNAGAERLRSALADPGLVAYVTAGDPALEATREHVEALAAGGADVIELGLPFSEPIADGPTIQGAIVRSLEGGTTPRSYLDLVADLEVDVPLVCMTYYNLIYQFGDGGADEERAVEPFVEAAAEAGLSGLIVPDLPVEESGPLRRACERHGLALVFIVAPTTTEARLARILAACSGFVYVQARMGTTGARADVSEQTYESLQRLPETDLPTAVGFGVSERDHARAIVAGGADGVVAGSVFVDRVAEAEDAAAAADALREKAAELAAGVADGAAERSAETGTNMP